MANRSNFPAARNGFRERAVLAAARQVFVEKGYKDSSISEIARRAGVASGTVYLYFENKENLLHHVLAVFVRDLTELVEQDLKVINGHVERLRCVIARHLQTLTAEPELCALFIREAHMPERQGAGLIQTVKHRYAAVLSHVLEEGMAAGALRNDISPAIARCIVIGGLEHLTLKTWSGRLPFDVGMAIDGLMRLLVRQEIEVDAAGRVLGPALERLEHIADRLTAATSSGQPEKRDGKQAASGMPGKTTV